MRCPCHWPASAYDVGQGAGCKLGYDQSLNANLRHIRSCVPSESSKDTLQPGVKPGESAFKALQRNEGQPP